MKMRAGTDIWNGKADNSARFCLSYRIKEDRIYPAMDRLDPKTAYVQRLVVDSLRTAEVVRGVLVLAAVSGGRDSVVLLHCLKELQPQFGYGLEAVHVEHGMRGDAAIRDAAFTMQLCGEWQIPCHVVHVDVPARAAETGESPEQAARNLRYDAIRETARATGAQWIATAHHADDQAETMLMGISRGSAGMLRGMRQITLDARGKILRPLLFAERCDIDAYAERHALRWTEDETNEDPSFARNRIRLDVMPYLKERMDPNIVQHLTLLSQRMQEEDALLEKLTEDCGKRCVVWQGPEEALILNSLSEEESALKRRVTEAALQRTGCARGLRTVRDILELFDAQPGKRVCLKQEHEALRERGGIRIRRIRETRDECVKLTVPGTTQTPWGTVRISEAQICGDPKTQGSVQWVPVTAERLYMRKARTAERIAPMGMEGTKLVSDVFSDAGVLLAAREDWPVIADETGPVWIPGICADRRMKVSAGEAAYFIDFSGKEHK